MRGQMHQLQDTVEGAASAQAAEQLAVVMEEQRLRLDGLIMGSIAIEPITSEFQRQQRQLDEIGTFLTLPQAVPLGIQLAEAGALIDLLSGRVAEVGSAAGRAGIRLEGVESVTVQLDTRLRVAEHAQQGTRDLHQRCDLSGSRYATLSDLAATVTSIGCVIAGEEATTSSLTSLSRHPLCVRMGAVEAISGRSDDKLCEIEGRLGELKKAVGLLGVMGMGERGGGGRGDRGDKGEETGGRGDRGGEGGDRGGGRGGGGDRGGASSSGAYPAPSTYPSAHPTPPAYPPASTSTTSAPTQPQPHTQSQPTSQSPHPIGPATTAYDELYTAARGIGRGGGGGWGSGGGGSALAGTAGASAAAGSGLGAGVEVGAGAGACVADTPLRQPPAPDPGPSVTSQLASSSWQQYLYDDSDEPSSPLAAAARAERDATRERERDRDSRDSNRDSNRYSRERDRDSRNAGGGGGGGDGGSARGVGGSSLLSVDFEQALEQIFSNDGQNLPVPVQGGGGGGGTGGQAPSAPASNLSTAPSLYTATVHIPTTHPTHPPTPTGPSPHSHTTHFPAPSQSHSPSRPSTSPTSRITSLRRVEDRLEELKAEKLRLRLLLQHRIQDM
ncbi:hypothetical protein B484DRAFT_58609 [Ochromonadaceae sp. CCMP2298]|nr:hypothetical protein B484DRAFT_58609 [Ochromonadaceae sp. CCMP2298]